MAGDMTSSVLVFAQQNETETETDNDLQKQNGPINETFINNNEEEKMPLEWSLTILLLLLVRPNRKLWNKS